MIQRRAARYTLNQYSYHSSVSAMLQHLCWPTLQQRRNQHQSPCYTNYNTDQFPSQIHTTQFHQEITNSCSHSLPQIIIYAHFSLEQSGCGIHYQTRQLIAQTWMFSSLVPNHSSIVNILCCFYPKKKMFIHQKYPVDVDVVLLNSLYSFLFSIHMFGVFFAHF